MMSDPIIVEQTFERSKEEVWKAITDHQQMIQWYFENIPDFKAEVGFITEFNVNSGERNFLHHWQILEVIPNQKVSYTWNYPDHKAEGRVSFELFDHGDSTLLRLSCFGIDDFPQDIPEFTRESCTGGWNYFIKERLTGFLNI